MQNTALKTREYAQDNFQGSELKEIKRLRIARIAEEAAHLPGNYNGPDFEEFTLQYGLSSSTFA